ncbi:MAG: pantoate--beta-alanine ligase [Saprospiraceae bacterium]|nr:pantoate--beta-alanine ligase [Saprospiraceae bacterium]
MYLFKTVQDYSNFLQHLDGDAASIGFVPTMGALHDGHLSLIEASREQNALTLCSIFVNPTQFNESTDLKKYPRTPAQDIEMLAAAGCDIIFMPSADEIYPPGVDLDSPIPPKGLVANMEGQFRPGHFEGVVQVVKRLLGIVQPARLYMGQKDYQQAAIIGWMLQSFELPVELVVCPIMREEDGLAMSSRNVRLDPDIRSRATLLYQTLSAVKERLNQESLEDLQAWAIANLSQKDFRPEYFDIVDGVSLQPLQDITPTDFVVACTAVWAGEVRLIDNMILQQNS